MLPAPEITVLPSAEKATLDTSPLLQPLLISAGDDTTILFWDVADVARRQRLHGGRLAEREWEALWNDLAGADAAKAYQAMARLASDKQSTLRALAERLRPARATDLRRVAELLKDLDSDQFAVRDKAARELERLRESSKPELERALARPGVSLDLRRRLTDILNQLTAISGERLRELRALEVLERLESPEARRLLETLAKGAPEARLTREAKSALERRLAERPAAAP